MASVVSHLVYADSYLKKNTNFQNGHEFMLGVAFPDVRYVSEVSRQQTHNCFERLDLDFTGMTAFEAGWKFHVWCDLRREEILRELGFFEIEGIENFTYFSFFALEDLLIWDKFMNWETIATYFRNSSSRNIFDELTESDWKFWYGIIADYIAKRPNKENIERILNQIPSFSRKVDPVLKEIRILAENKKITETLKKLHLKIV